MLGFLENLPIVVFSANEVNGNKTKNEQINNGNIFILPPLVTWNDNTQHVCHGNRIDSFWNF